MKKMLFALVSLSFLSSHTESFAKHHGKMGMDKCKSAKCHNSRDPGSLKSCLAEKRNCIQNQFSKMNSKFSENGIRAKKKEKILSRLKKRKEMFDIRKDHFDEMEDLIESQIDKVNSFKNKDE